MTSNTHDLVLLTGAGFTKNFGGFLAQEAWARLFNNSQIQKNAVLRSLLQNDFDFESAYAEVFSNPVYSDDDKRLMTSALEQMYESLDQVTNNWIFRDENPTAFNVYHLQELIGLFVGTPTKKGMFFTLNQDLLMERRYQYAPPGVSRFTHEIYHTHASVMGKQITLPSEIVLQKYKDEQFQNSGDLTYVKLHGSYGWYSASGQHKMVVGKNKSGQISEEPLLKWYFELFQSCLFEGNKKLLIIGYSFFDEHINNVLKEAVQNYGLRLFVLAPTKPADMKKRIDPILWNAISGYFPYTFREVFSPDQSRTVMFDEMLAMLRI